MSINEVLADNEDGLEDGDGDRSDWIELYAVEAVDLEGWTLTDDQGEPWTFPARSLVAGELVVVFASGKGDEGPDGELHTSFRLDADGETLTLARPDERVADEVIVPALPPDTSWGPSQVVTAAAPLEGGAAGRLSFSEEGGWLEPGFDDAAWTAVTLPVGYDLTGDGGGDAENAALERPTEQSTDGYGYTGAQAVDGEPSTFSHTGDADVAPRWSVDLEADWSISAITLFNRVGCCPERLYNLTVSVLDAEGTVVWASEVLNPVAEGGTPTDPGSTLELAPGVVGRTVRLDKVAVNGAGSSEWLSLGEVVVTGTRAAPYADGLSTDLGATMPGAEAWVRVPFTVDAAPSRAVLTLAYDDAIGASIDGESVIEANLGNGAAIADHDGEEPVDVVVTLTAGDHVLALLGQNADTDDFLLGATLATASWVDGDDAFFAVPTPGEPNGQGIAGLVEEPTLDPPRGFYDDATTVTITTATPGATLVYTLDGTAPTLANGTVVSPADAGSAPLTTVGVDTTAMLRAAAFLEGWSPSDVATHTYLFLADVVRQPAAPAGLPTTWDGMSETAVTADYEMDPEVVDDPTYTDDLLSGLRGIPTLSVVMDPADLFGEADGIYIHSAERGDTWERAASVELILPDGSTGFAEDCGIQVHGWGWRYHSSTKKHSFRLEFRSEYGASQLEYPLFADSTADRFDSIVLRAGGSKTWLDFRDPAQAQYLHDAFARDTALAMGKADGHATFVHLYLNGLYWGLYDPVERPDAGFGARYFGGDADDYDAINRRTVTNEAIDGTLDAYNALLALADEDLSTGYDAIAAMLDVDDLIDYMLLHQYTVNRDGPCCFSHNNMRGVRERVDGGLFRFFVWDMEYSLWDATDDTNVDIDVSGAISHVYARLQTNDAFRARYAERAREHLTGTGALTPDAAAARYEARANEIHDALVGESARWGDTYRTTPYTRDAEWQVEYDRLMTDYFPARTAALIDQLTAAGLY